VATNVDQDVVYKALGVSPESAELSKALERAFEPCFPDGFERKWGAYPNLEFYPLLASMTRDGRDSNVHLNILIKTRDAVKREKILLSQHESSHKALRLSTKYGRIFNSISGDWAGLCDEEDQCGKCEAIRLSPAKNNAYDDEEVA
jgi:hypothetical protein